MRHESEPNFYIQNNTTFSNVPSQWELDPLGDRKHFRPLVLENFIKKLLALNDKKEMNTWEVQCHLGEGEGIIKHNDTQLNCLNIY